MVVINNDVCFPAIKKLPNPPRIKCPNKTCKAETLYITSYYPNGKQRQEPVWTCRENCCNGKRKYNLEDILAFISYYNEKDIQNRNTFSSRLYRTLTEFEYADITFLSTLSKWFNRLISQRIGLDKFNASVTVPSPSGVDKTILTSALHLMEKELNYIPEAIHPKNLQDIRAGYELTNPEELKGKRILLIDDIVRTGSAIDPISRLIAEASGNLVYTAALAKQI